MWSVKARRVSRRHLRLIAKSAIRAEQFLLLLLLGLTELLKVGRAGDSLLQLVHQSFHLGA